LRNEGVTVGAGKYVTIHGLTDAVGVVTSLEWV